jgi:hypothetical protein
MKQSYKGDQMTNTTKTQEALKAAMNHWNRIESAARKQFPNMTPDELYEVCRNAMNHPLGIT